MNRTLRAVHVAVHFRALSEIFSLLLGGDVSDNLGVWVPADLRRLSVSSCAVVFLER